ncbi:MAG TPA: glucose-1-phosphate cytidylyltransferase [Acidimicrobiales bacterium]|nr:glucose-1-phosphate cytidylyltransferase [Acidimicrobiales bacterium]
MKAVILAGGRGSRLAEVTDQRPKPLVEIGGRPMIWHIMKIYSHHGVNDFVVCLGYKGYLLKEYFSNLALHDSDVTVDVATRTVQYHQAPQLPWRVTLVDTGIETMTGGRIRRVLPYIGDDETFCLTYGDGVGNIDITASLDFHQSQGLLATMTVVRPPARFGTVHLLGDGRVEHFEEKGPAPVHTTNGGFFVLDRRAVDYIAGDHTSWEVEPLQALAAEGQLAAFRHDGFWQPMDTVWERDYLEQLWSDGAAPWKVWP